MSYTSYQTINSLSEISFIGGSEYSILFKVYDQSGSPANISGATCTWKMSPYGQPNVVTQTYSSSSKPDAYSFIITILSADTLALSGKYVHQPIIVDGGKTYRSQQGIITIIPAIN